MSAKDLLRDLRTSGVEVSAHDGYIDLDAPRGVLTDELIEAVAKAKPRLLKLLVWEQRKLEEADRRGLVIKYAREPGWISLHDPTTGEWHEVHQSECLPSIVEVAKTNHRNVKGSR
jgi:TubC N-terminal docking domain